LAEFGLFMQEGLTTVPIANQQQQQQQQICFLAITPGQGR